MPIIVETILVGIIVFVIGSLILSGIKAIFKKKS